MGFAEFDNEDLANFAIRYLNNMELVTNKGLIAEFSLEDARAIHLRERRFEKLKKLNDEKKREKRKEQKTAETPVVIGGVVDLGKRKQLKQEVVPIDKITDVEQLH